MNVIIKLERADINTGRIGNNYQVVTKTGLTIIFDKDAIKELCNDYYKDSYFDSENAKKEKINAVAGLTQ